MIDIAVLTATRAEYGLLKPVILKLMVSDNYRVHLLVTGAHLSDRYGRTSGEIEADGIPIFKQIEILSDDDSAKGISAAMGNAMIRFGELFDTFHPDALMVLGDRYETMAVCCAAMNARIPIIHLYGGETTEGAVDEAIRHSITKMSWLHFTSTQEYRKRVIQLGEDPSRVYCVGALGVENALTQPLFPENEIRRELGIRCDRPYAVMTYHPVTLENSVEEQTQIMLRVLESQEGVEFVVTKANADVGGCYINQALEQYASGHKNIHLFASLGMKRYLSAVKYADYVIGNSSSGIIEVPSFKVPTVNIGDRQKGRMHADSVLDCVCELTEIRKTIEKAQSEGFRKTLQDISNPYGSGNTSGKILSVLDTMFSRKTIDLKKKFYDIQVDWFKEET